MAWEPHWGFPRLGLGRDFKCNVFHFKKAKIIRNIQCGTGGPPTAREKCKFDPNKLLDTLHTTRPRVNLSERTLLLACFFVGAIADEIAR